MSARSRATFCPLCQEACGNCHGASRHAAVDPCALSPCATKHRAHILVTPFPVIAISRSVAHCAMWHFPVPIQAMFAHHHSISPRLAMMTIECLTSAHLSLVSIICLSSLIRPSTMCLKPAGLIGVSLSERRPGQTSWTSSAVLGALHFLKNHCLHLP